MPLQKLTVEIETQPISEDERPELASEIARAVQALLLPYLDSADALVARLTRWEEKP
jgi:hypothetical protein